MKRCSDKRLMWLVNKALHALEDPASGFVFDDFDRRYREAEWLREKKSAAWYYRNKLSLEAKYEADCGQEACNEPAWVSDRGKSAAAMHEIIAYEVDKMAKEPLWLYLWRKKRLELTAKQRAVLDALAIDWRTLPAAKIAGVSRPTVNLCKKIFKVHFAQCFQVWKRDFAF